MTTACRAKTNNYRLSAHACYTPPIRKVINGNVVNFQFLAKAAATSLRTTIGSHRLELEAGDEDWVTLSLKDVLIFLINESPHFKLLIEDTLRRAGA